VNGQPAPTVETYLFGGLPTLSSFTNVIDLGSDITFYFNLVTPSSTFLDFAVSAPTSPGGWLGIGFSRRDNFQMRGSDAFIGNLILRSNCTSLKPFLLTTKALDLSGIATHPFMTYVSASASYFNSTTTLLIRRKLLDGYNPIYLDSRGQMNGMIIAAYSTDKHPGFQFKHQVRVPYGTYINFRTGQYETAYRYAIPVRVAHGVMMGTAYALLFPLGLMFARYGKSEGDTKSWFRAHFFLQNYAFVIMLVGIIIGYTLPEIQFGSFTYHAYLGTVIFVFTFIQITMGYLRPHKEKGAPPSVPRRIFEFIHHWLGRSIVIMAIAQIAAGIQELGVSPFAYGIWIPIVVVLFIISVVLEIRNCFKIKGPIYEYFL